MAYVHDISVLMRELLKVPKDYTPTAVEISKYIRSRYSNNQTENTRKRPMGTRAFSSASRSAPPRMAHEIARPPQPTKQAQTPLHLLNRHQKMSGRGFTYSTVHEKLKQPVIPARKTMQHSVLEKVERKGLTTFVPKKTPIRMNIQRNDIWDQKPKTAPPIKPVEPPVANRQSFWNWKSAKSHIRRAMSDLVVSSPGPTKNKLNMLSEKMKLDPQIEQSLQAKKKGVLQDMVDPEVAERVPLRTREIIQRLVEENKLEDQRKEIARLTELARSKVMEARRANLVPTKNRKRRDERF